MHFSQGSEAGALLFSFSGVVRLWNGVPEGFCLCCPFVSFDTVPKLIIKAIRQKLIFPRHGSAGSGVEYMRCAMSLKIECVK